MFGCRADNLKDSLIRKRDVYPQFSMQGFGRVTERDEMNHMTWEDSCVVASPGRSVILHSQGERRDAPRK